MVYPTTQKAPFDTIIYNTKLADDYAWLSLPENETQMLQWAKTQTNFTNTILDSIPGKEIISDLLVKLNAPNPDEIIVKGVHGGDIYYYKTLADGQRWLLQKTDGDDTEEKISTIPFAVQGKKYSAKKYAFAHQKKLLALMLTESGDGNPHIRFFNLETKTFLKDSIGAVMYNDASGVSMAWLPDDSGLIYSQAPTSNNEAEKYYRGQLKIHFLESKNNPDDAIFGFGVNASIPIKEYETPYIYSFPYSPYLIARIRAGKGENYAFAIHYKQLKGSQTAWLKLKDYRCNHGTFTATGPFLYAVDDAVPNMQLIKVDLKTGKPPEVILPESEKILSMSTGDPSIVSGRNIAYIKYNAAGKQGILKWNLKNVAPTELQMPFDGSVMEFNLLKDDALLFVSTNWIRNFEYFKVQPNTNQIVSFQPSASTGFDASNYTSEIRYIPSRDGIAIPVSLVYKKGLEIGKNPSPMLIEAYGCFGASMDPYFFPENFVWLELGGIYAVAHIRGGSELGAQWYTDGAYPNKMNSINDVVDVADYFIKNNITTGFMQAISGASCGTINVGLATLQRPELFSAGVFSVGIPDLVTNKGTSFGRGQNDFGPLDTEEGFISRLSISAYHHIIPNKKAPAMLVINGVSDYIVPLHNTARYVAKLQQVQQSERPALFMVDWQSGHATAGNSEEDIIRKWKFLLWQTGNKYFQPKLR
jgi:prolyl oligopeptidase